MYIDFKILKKTFLITVYIMLIALGATLMAFNITQIIFITDYDVVQIIKDNVVSCGLMGVGVIGIGGLNE